MYKKYHIHLTKQEILQLQEIVRTRKSSSVQVKRALILLAADVNGELNWNDEQIAKAYCVGISTVERLRHRFVIDGFYTALHGKKREVFKDKIFDGAIESHLISLRCSHAPKGYSRWTLHLLADKMVELGYVEQMSHESVRQILKKTSLSPGG
ncbi:MAG: helix-turn-helix domain-containing protein [Alphaproteobacteria bacterium]|nr:helix-turn-helix domain-containing protein [Alphaproteobacteria bacterium]